MRSYVAVFLAGQSGNQLFQLVAGEYIKRKLFDPESRIVVLEPFEKRSAIWTYDHYRQALNRLESKSCSFLLSRSLEIEKSRFLRFLLFLARTIVMISCGVKLGKFPKVLVSVQISAAPEIQTRASKRPIVLIGYFQNYFWEDDDEQMREAIHSYIKGATGGSELTLSKCNQSYVVLHVRRTDYVNEPSLGMLTERYYRAAIAQILSACPEVRKVLVLTDDANLEKDFLSDSFMNFEIIGPERASAQEAFEIMRQSENLVISNSSFSWWAAYMNHNRSVRVVYPRPWFRQLEAFKNNPLSWISIKSDWAQDY